MTFNKGNHPFALFEAVVLFEVGRKIQRTLVFLSFLFRDNVFDRPFRIEFIRSFFKSNWYYTQIQKKSL